MGFLKHQHDTGRIGETAAQANTKPEHRIPAPPHRCGFAVMQTGGNFGSVAEISGMALDISSSPSTFHFENPPIIGELIA
jgi:hypothetical protein